MQSARWRVKQSGGAIPTVELEDPAAASVVELAPDRGAIVIRFAVAGRELLYLDRATFDDRAANVRGGVPVLFPSPGKLAGDAWSRGGRSGSMKQHGFARALPWELVSASDEAEGGASARLRLRSNEETRARYPWDFEAELTYTLRGRALRIDSSVANVGEGEMPFGAGFHPYFAVLDEDKATVEIPTRATRAFDNVTKREIPFQGFDFGAAEVDLHLLDHGAADGSLRIGGRAPASISLRGSPEFTRWVVWSLRGRDFVCLEPWTCPGDALNTGDRLITLSPGERRAMWIEIGCG